MKPAGNNTTPAALAAKIRALEARLDASEDPTLILPQSRLHALIVGVATVAAALGAWAALSIVREEA